jgi:hypothetical protein
LIRGDPRNKPFPHSPVPVEMVLHKKYLSKKSAKGQERGQVKIDKAGILI